MNNIPENHEQAITKAVSSLLYTQRFFAHLLHTKTPLRYAPQCETARTDGKTMIEVGPWFCEERIPRQIFVLAHEVLHGIMLHMDRGKHYIDSGIGPDGKPFCWQTWAEAADYIINYILKHSHIGEMPECGLYDPRFTGGMSTEEVYIILRQEKEEQGEQGAKPEGDQAGPPQQGGMPDGEGEPDGKLQPAPQPGTSTSHGSFDEHIVPGEPMTEGEKKDLEREVMVAAKQAEAIGQMPGGLREFMDRVFNPEVPWTELVRREFHAASANIEPDWSRPNKKRVAYGEAMDEQVIILPSTQSLGAGTVMVQIDTSGSIGDEQIAVFMGGIKSLVEDVAPSELYILWTDTHVAHTDLIEHDHAAGLEEVIERVKREGAPGGGGTDMGAMWKYCEEWGVSPNIAVTFTDGLTPWPENSAFAHITVLSKGATRECPFGMTVESKV